MIDQTKNLNSKSMMLIVENRLIHSLELSIAQYKTDLENEGYQVEVNSEPSASSSPVEIRNLLQED